MNEDDRRRLKWQLVKEAWDADPTYSDQRNELPSLRAERAGEAKHLIEELRTTADVETFRTALQAWSQRPGYAAFRGFGMMFIHQLVKATDDAPAAAELLVDVLSEPVSEDDAAAKIRRCVAHVEKIKQAGHPAPKRAPFVLSLFWSMADEAAWPCLWQSGDKTLSAWGWLSSSGDLDRWYLDYRKIVLESGLPVFDAETLLWWIDEANPFVGLDPALVDRCVENVELANAWKANDSRYPSVADAALAERNIRAINGELRLVGGQLERRVGAALGRELTLRLAGTKYSNTDCFRSDSYLAWQTGKGSDEPSIWLWVGDEGVALGLHPGWREKGWMSRVADELQGDLPRGVTFLRWHDQFGGRIEAVEQEHPGGQFLIGGFFPGNDALGEVGFAATIEQLAAILRPVVDRVVLMSGGASDELSRLVDRFRTEKPYPTPSDALQIDERGRLAGALTSDALGALDREVFSEIINTQRYGGPGPQANLNRALGEATPEALEDLAAAFAFLLWNDSEPVARRIDRVIDQEDLGIKGLGEAIVMKLLAIARPNEFIPAFPYRGDNGKRRMMEMLGLAPLDEKTLSRGELQVASNDQLKGLLDPYFPDDPWGEAQFLFWLLEAAERTPPPPGETHTIGDADLAGLAEELLLDASFLEEVRALLAEKGQVIFYGPPGTGKTYVAKRLAETLVEDSGRRTIVQFHPSTSYEDFFEGYRPRVNADGGMTYEVTAGPLARMAELAVAAPGVDHIMIIDEINRANLPKVFGELLFLLEYRRESVQILNRPDQPFSLPKNLYFIGTMNTADRSIALVDAALRRRFHFVPFFPEQDQMEGLLGRWLKRNDGDVRIAALLEQVNLELVQDVGEHLQIGPSYFMRPGIAESDLRRIWRYGIEPFVEEQLFGQTSEIKRYKWDEVRRRLWGALSSGPDDEPVIDVDAAPTATASGQATAPGPQSEVTNDA